MLRKILAVAAGIVSWMVLVTVSDRLMRLCWPDYAGPLSASAKWCFVPC